MNLHSHLLLLLGVPVHAIPKELLEEVFNDLMQKYPRDLKPSYATTLQTASLGCSEILRQASFIGVDSKPLQILLRLLGNPIRNRISSQDLLHAAAKLASKHHQSLYILGKDLEVCHLAAKALKEDYPGLKIAGFVAPSIHIKGPNIEISCERDPWIVENINSTKPAILLMDYGHPKQEIWFDRIKHLLKVPLCIGVGGSLEEYLNNRSQRETKTSRKFGLRTFAHYVWKMPPLLLFTTLNRFLSRVFYKSRRRPLERRHLFLSEKESLFVIPFPSLIYQQAWSENPEWLEECLEYDYVILDFTPVHHLDLAGMGLLYKVWMEMTKQNKSLFLLGLSNDIKHLLKLHNAWDMVQHLVVQDADEVLDRMSINRHAQLKTEREFVSIYQTDHSTILSFFGRIDKMQAPVNSLNHLEPLLNHRSCVINLKYCTSISNHGFSFLLKLKNMLKVNESSLVLAHVNKAVLKQIKDSKLESEFLVES